MKKTLIALAAVAATSAFAQSSVTLSGRLDLWLGSVETTTAGVVAPKVTKLDNGGLTGSRWKINGSEDLGGGLKANFSFENRFSPDTGADTDGFTGHSTVGFSGGFGSIDLGRTYTTFDDVKAISVSSSVFDSAFTPSAVPAYAVRGANQIKYVSPMMGGLKVALNHSPSEAFGTKNMTGIAAMYSAGALSAGIASQSDAAGKNMIVSGAYNMGVASISAGYSTLDTVNNGNDSSGYNLGVNVPMGKVQFSLGVANGSTDTNAGAKVSDYKGIGLGVKYTLSKRSSLYAGYTDTETKTVAGLVTAGTKLYAAGVRHDF